MKIFTVEWEKKVQRKKHRILITKMYKEYSESADKKKHIQKQMSDLNIDRCTSCYTRYFFSFFFDVFLLVFEKKKEENNTQERLSSVRG